MKYFTTYMSPIGKLILISEGEALSGLYSDNQKYFDFMQSEMAEKKDLSIFNETKNWLDRYFSKEKPQISELKLAPCGSEFRYSVWEILCKIPYGSVVTYGEIAKEMAEKLGKNKMSSQAVGGAIGHNPIGIIIPCHRVIGSDGNLTGYAGGIDKKVFLLCHEGFNQAEIIMPKK